MSLESYSRKRTKLIRSFYFMNCFFGFIAFFALSSPSGLISNTFASDRGISTSAEEVRPLLTGQSVPSVQVKSIDGKVVNLKELVSIKPAVIVFYRGGWCPFCNLQLKELKTVEPELLKLNYQLIAISADRIEELKKSKSKHDISYSLFSDSSMEAARAFGLAFKVDDSTLGKHKTYGIDLEKSSGEVHHVLPVPAVFIVSKDGEIKFEYVNPNYKVRLNSKILTVAAQVYAEPRK